MNQELTSRQVCDIVIEKIKKRVPYFVMRMGDGDTIMSQPNNPEWKEWFARVSNRNLGYVINSAESVTVKNNIESALSAADLLGLGTERHRKLNQFWKDQPSIVADILSRNQIYPLPKICSIDCHVEMLQGGMIDSIINSTPHLVVISPRKLESRFRSKYGIDRSIEYYQIPPEAAFSTGRLKSNLLTDIHDTIINRINEKDRTGQLCIFGAGFVGKDFGSTFKKAGGVALDLGSVFDLWDGKITRGKDRDAESKNKQYML
jgi:hypothetical protein